MACSSWMKCVIDLTYKLASFPCDDTRWGCIVLLYQASRVTRKSFYELDTQIFSVGLMLPTRTELIPFFSTLH